EKACKGNGMGHFEAFFKHFVHFTINMQFGVINQIKPVSLLITAIRPSDYAKALVTNNLPVPTPHTHHPPHGPLERGGKPIRIRPRLRAPVSQQHSLALLGRLPEKRTPPIEKAYIGNP
ncbi:MAG: hypothetical protein SV775_08650, partial [Thermodesulfobacteriota bacterium]|nr:hypothetical protein [Thermodesulfobacteriota bacterium]